MLYIHLCSHCDYFHIRNGHKDICPICGNHTREMDISYKSFVQLDEDEREIYKKICRQNVSLHTFDKVSNHDL